MSRSLPVHDAVVETRLLQRLEQATSDLEREALEADVAEQFLAMAKNLARRYAGRGVDLDELSAVASYALVKAIRGYSSDRGAFAPYAAVTISGEIKRFFRDHSWSLRPPRSVQELQADVIRATDDRRAHGRTATAQELAAELGRDVADVREAMGASAFHNLVSLDDHRPGGTGWSVADPVDPMAKVEDHDLLMRCLADLGDEERELLRLRFFEDRSQSEIAEVFGVSQMSISRRLKALTEKMRRVAVDEETTSDVG